MPKANNEKAISTLPNGTIYNRNNTDLPGFYYKFSEELHVKAKLGGKNWIGDGCLEPLDPNEKVLVIQLEEKPTSKVNSHLH